MASHNPHVLYHEATQAIQRIPNAILFNSNAHKRLLEKWCAARFGQGFSRYVAECEIDIEDRDEQREYDFHLVTSGIRYPFQIVEVLDSDRRRGKEYWAQRLRPAPNLASEPVDSPQYGQERISEELHNKIRRYGPGAKDLHMLAYLNMVAPQQRWSNVRRGLRHVTRHFASVWAITDRYILCIMGGQHWLKEAGWKPISE